MPAGCVQRGSRCRASAVAASARAYFGPVTVIGHSAGAQAMLLFAADPSAPIDAVLALDMTQDYALLTDRSWAYVTDKVIEHRKAIRAPSMFVAGPRALFELADSVTAARRWLVTVPELGHNDYLMQGIVRRELSRAAPVDSLETVRKRRAYDALVTYLGAWLDAFIASGGNTSGPAAPAPLTVELVPAGASVVVNGRGGAVPARVLRHLFTTTKGSEFTDAFLAARRAGHDAGSNDVLMMLLTGTIAGGHRERATSVSSQLSARDSTVRRGVLDLIADRKRVFERYSLRDLAEIWQEYLTLLDPSGAVKPRP